MKLIIDNNRIIGTATDEHSGGETMAAPLDFDITLMGEYRVVDGELVLLPPQSVSMRQARLQLLALGSLATVNGAIATMPEVAQTEWGYATEVQRTNPLVPAMAGLLGWSEADTDMYFTEAAKL